VIQLGVNVAVEVEDEYALEGIADGKKVKKNKTSIANGKCTKDPCDSKQREE
jgi:hypothetical protein